MGFIMKNYLFNQALLRKYSTNFKLTPRKYDLLKEYINKVETGDLKSETKNYLYFYDVILKDLLGYNRDDVLFDEKGDEGAGRSEFVLKSDDKKFMVIEIKGQGIDLDKRQSGRPDNKSPVEQAFGYAINTGDIDWIMVSNYDEFRLYNYYEKTKYISFNVEELLDKEMFAYFMLSFSRGSHIESDNIKRVSEDTLIVDRKLASEFYKLYNETRLMLIKELEAESGLERLDAIHYAQLILNRYMFICFAEDTKLLPSQISTDTIATPIQKGNIRHGSIWQRLNELCLDINEGNEFKKINEYNGGLFHEDLNFIKIRDLVEDQNFFNDVYQDYDFTEYEKDITPLLGTAKERINPIYRNMLTISSFDFSTELDVNILGHIFENSIGDIEELKEDSKGRRKKEGIFYTPDYITDYICRNTILPYLSKSGKSNTVADLISEYWGSAIEELDHKVKNIKVVDPACGSGAFLNKASDILLEIHQMIHETRYKDKQNTLKPYFDNIGQRREILLNNIYGVDLNEESVDTTKLSLFLKVCRKGLKLPNLDENIKCGNSLIDDSAYSNRPFIWEKEFPEIFNDGGFDVVIGNPPYVRQEKIKEIKPYLKEHYEVYSGVADLFVYFFEIGLKILNTGGMFAFICSDRFTNTKYGKNLRKFILKYQFKEYIYHSENAFDNAVVLACTIIIRKLKPTKEDKIIYNDTFEIPQNSLNDDFWSFENPILTELNDKIEKTSIKIKDIPDITISYGIKTGLNDAFIIDKQTRNEIIKKDPNSENIIKPLIRGKDVHKWRMDYKDLFLIFTRRGIDIDKYPAINEFLFPLKDKLTPKNEGELIGRKPGDYKWFEIQDTVDYYKEFEKEKIIWTEMTPNPSFTLDNQGMYLLNTNYSITVNNAYDLRYLLSLLNSNLLFFIFKRISPKLYAKRLRFVRQYVAQLPIYPATHTEQKLFNVKVDKILNLNQQLQNELYGFHDWLKHTFNIDKLSQKLEAYYKLSLDEFLDETKKKRVNIKSRQNYQTLKEEYEKSLHIINPLLKEINQIDNEINQRVYELYGLTEDEIKIIEDNLSS